LVFIKRLNSPFYGQPKDLYPLGFKLWWKSPL